MALLNAYTTAAAHSTPNFPSTLQDPLMLTQPLFYTKWILYKWHSTGEGRDAAQSPTAAESLGSAALIENDPSADSQTHLGERESPLDTLRRTQNGSFNAVFDAFFKNHI